ncbi:uncharacterized protein LOC110370951 isoform X2 [Helicoverpa armigera]|uniref:uncharacterized protein LOC110370951 isoform X2 n=1 Tax=Helicoverpa armigera TaxID=29058 RepID=UPI0021118A0A|nr:uncharacterized protein LOC110370951 isoform X2 [Helicoverpa armigera]
MADIWTILVILFALIETVRLDSSFLDDVLEDPPLTRSLGFAIRKRFDKTLDDARLNQEYMYRYNEMLKASQESFESFASRDERRLRRVVGDHNYEIMREGVLDRRRNAPRFQSPVGRRRARTQALRRQKLNSQSLRSHLQHSRQTTADYNTLRIKRYRGMIKRIFYSRFCAKCGSNLLQTN